ncbi:MAG: C10 family peptidase, partial [Bacteroidales bacterium]|nr:C10 family peptidase [Bacteroidales bacterium]
MRKHLIAIATAMTWFASTIFAQPVDMKSIERVAINAYSELAIETGRVLLDKIAITEVIPVKDDAENLLYCIVNIMDSGFTIVSADKMMIPVLGRSLKGQFSFDKAPPGLLYLLEKYKYEGDIARNSGTDRNDWVDALWSKYNVEVDNFASPKSAKIVTPLLTTEWGQRGGFNRFCPPFGGETRYPAGCVAVAMAQVLNYWACRVNETGTKSYTWNSQTLTANIGHANYQWTQMHPTQIG